LELCFGTSLQDTSIRRKYLLGDGGSNQFLDIAAAIEWNRSVEDEAGPEYAEAVAWCLRGYRPEGRAWRQDLMTNVITPLSYCHQQLRASQPASANVQLQNPAHSHPESKMHASDESGEDETAEEGRSSTADTTALSNHSSDSDAAPDAHDGSDETSNEAHNFQKLRLVSHTPN